MSIFGYGGGYSSPYAKYKIRLHARACASVMCGRCRSARPAARSSLRAVIRFAPTSTAILSDDLANSQVSPFEVTTPKILKKAGYQNAMFGKFHLAGPENNPLRTSTPHVLGWDYFDGFLEGAPHPIDTSIGGQFTDTSNPTTHLSPMLSGIRAGLFLIRSSHLTERIRSLPVCELVLQRDEQRRDASHARIQLPAERRHLRSQCHLPVVRGPESQLQPGQRVLRLEPRDQPAGRHRDSLPERDESSSDTELCLGPDDPIGGGLDSPAGRERRSLDGDGVVRQ